MRFHSGCVNVRYASSVPFGRNAVARTIALRRSTVPGQQYARSLRSQWTSVMRLNRAAYFRSVAVSYLREARRLEDRA